MSSMSNINSEPRISSTSAFSPWPLQMPFSTHAVQEYNRQDISPSYPATRHFISNRQQQQQHVVNDEIFDEHAVIYLNHVKEELGNHPHIYSEFIDLLEKVGKGEMETVQVIERVQSLFEGHDNLLAGFNIFLPKCTANSRNLCHVETESAPNPLATTNLDMHHHLRENQESPPFVLDHGVHEYERAIHYVETVRDRLGEDSHAYKSFLCTLHEYKLKGHGYLDNLLDKVATLFASHEDLLQEFIPYLPQGIQEPAKCRFFRRVMNPNDKQSQHKPRHDDSLFGSCTVCFNQQKSHAFIPCGHLSVCNHCASRCMLRFGKCPVCNQKATKTMKIYFS